LKRKGPLDATDLSAAALSIALERRRRWRRRRRRRRRRRWWRRRGW
jgi:hypothetical protein